MGAKQNFLREREQSMSDTQSNIQAILRYLMKQTFRCHVLNQLHNHNLYFNDPSQYSYFAAFHTISFVDINIFEAK